MKREHIEFDLILRWLPDSAAFDFMLNYNHPNDLEDSPFWGESPIRLDTIKLSELVGDEDRYSRELSSMLYVNDHIRQAFQKALDAAAILPVHLRLVIDPQAGASYQAIRWESLRDPGLNFPLTTRENVRFSRHLADATWPPITPLAKEGQLRALVVVASPSNLEDYSQLGQPSLAQVDVSKELELARKAMENLSVKTLPSPTDPEARATLDNIIDRLRSGVNILYLICHGTIVDGTSRLLLEDKDGKVAEVSGADFGRRIASLAAPPTLAVLGSCQSAGPGDEYLPSESGPFAPVGPLLAKAGVAIVLAMQGNVTMTTTSKFLSRFFTEFNRDGLADRAAAVARDAVSERPDWWMPVLFSRLRRGKPWYEPRFGAQRTRMFRDLRTRIAEINCTPVLGSGIAGESFLPQRSDLAENWVLRRQIPMAVATRRDLAKVAQYLSVDSGPDMPRNELTSHLRADLHSRFKTLLPDLDWVETPLQVLISEAGRLCREDRGDRDPYAILAKNVMIPIYITTSWTTLLEDALVKEGRPPDVRYFEWNQNRLRTDGEPPQPTVHKPLVYHLFGSLGGSPIVLTEDDYFGWLRSWIKRVEEGAFIPPEIKSALIDRSLLFLGYGLDDWEFRVLFQSIKSFEGISRLRDHRHVGVQLRPETATTDQDAAQDYLERYFGDDNVEIYWGSCTEFLNDLRDSSSPS